MTTLILPSTTSTGFTFCASRDTSHYSQLFNGVGCQGVAERVDEAGLPRSFGARLDHLMRAIPGPGGKPWTNGRLSEALAERGVTVSGIYISQLRSGRKDNPAASYIGAFARVLGVPVSYFYDEDTSSFDAELTELAALRDSGVHKVAMLARGVSPEGLDQIQAMVEYIRKAEGLPAPQSPPEPPKGS